MTFDEYLAVRRARVDAALDRLLPAADAKPTTIHAAMRHSVFAGGKRIRPVLAIAAGEALGTELGAELPGCAVECIHTYSLIHDDLPALDNDDLRRGKPTCHKVYGEAMAILAGDGLLTVAFKILAELDAPAENRAAMIAELATAAGTVDGMIGGQVADLEAEGKPLEADQLRYIHRSKTGALIRASVRLGAQFAQASPEQHQVLSEYGRHIGLAFQIVDDLLDVEGDTEEVGKKTGKDDAAGKATFVSLLGRERARDQANMLADQATQHLEMFGEKANSLGELARFVVDRRA